MPKAKFEIQFDGQIHCRVTPAPRAAALRRLVTGGNYGISLEVATADGGAMMTSLWVSDAPKGLVVFKWAGEQLTVKLKGVCAMPDSDLTKDPQFATAASAGAVVSAGLADADGEILELEPDAAITVQVGTLRQAGGGAAAGKAGARRDLASIRKALKEMKVKPRFVEAMELLYSSDDELPEVLHRLSGGGKKEVDYAVEDRLEALAEAITSRSPDTQRMANCVGSTNKEFRDLLMSRWLECDVPGCGYETKVRASEALAAWSVRFEEARAEVLKRLKHKRWEHRMWAARIVRMAAWTDADKVLAPLKKDPFEDDNGIPLVREAAGFGDG